MPVVQRSVVINAPAEKVFDFHTDIRNLPLISPSWMKPDVVRTIGEGKGKIIELYMTQFGIIRNKWVIEISEFERPTRITDCALEGPFKLFRHERDIRPVTDLSCELTDTFNYELPLGVIGRISDRLFMRRFVERMFEARHKKTKQLLEKP